MQHWIKDNISQKEDLLKKLEIDGYMSVLEDAGTAMIETLKGGNKIMIAGNGGSAADAQHFAGEILGRFELERAPLPAISLCVDPSVVTSIANDYSYQEVFSRQIEGIGREGDLFAAISTSGNSENLIYAIRAAKKKKIKVIGFLGKDGGRMKELCDCALIVPSDATPRIQEIHIWSIHLLCEMIEKELFT
ncbi:D-sedoheptulose-7-phosphate isomerase [Parablautia muri]|nr:SIS domain-containing protein [Parablautia muri]